MSILKKIVITHVTVLCLSLVGCTTARQPDLTGKWLNSDKAWGLEFRDRQVSEWERDKIQSKGSFTLTKVDDTLTLVVTMEKGGVVSFTLELLGENSIRLTHMKLNTQIELKRE